MTRPASKPATQPLPPPAIFELAKAIARWIAADQDRARPPGASDRP